MSYDLPGQGEIIHTTRAARLLGVTSGWLNAEAARGALPGVAAGKTFLFNFGDLQKAIAMRANQQCDALLTLKRAARRFKVDEAWLRERADAGDIPALRATPDYLFSARALYATLLNLANGNAGPGRGGTTAAPRQPNTPAPSRAAR